MRNPLFKRLPRELRDDLGKYIALFLFLILTIGFCSGFLVAGGSLKTAYDESFEKYNIENGHFTLFAEADASLIKTLEEEKLTVFELFHKDRELENDHSIRIYKIREDVNRADLMSGSLPEKEDEIVIDRLYAANNGIRIGDSMEIGDQTFRISGFVALSDYSALYKNNTDMMFDANQFTIAMVTDEGFEKLDETGLSYTYAWVNDDRSLSDKEQIDKSDELKELLAENTILTDFVARQDNQAIMFTGDDMGGDKILIQWLLYIVIVVLAFTFAMATRNTIEQESSVIGTLLASGYTKNELMRHYLTLPVLVTLAAALIGNIIGYTGMKKVVAALYYHSYSLPTYKTIWNAEAFILTTVIPCIIILAVNLLILRSALSLPALQFLRHELKKHKKARVMRLPRWRFLTRFRIRIILQNLPIYLTMFAGILFASVLLLFGMMFSPLLQQFKTEVRNSKIAEYQYILKAPLETKTEGAEKYSVTSLENDRDEEITIYGISEDSEYLKNLELYEDGAVLSDGLMEKYGIETGDEITLSEKYGGSEYVFTVKDSYHYPAAMAVFLPSSAFHEIFDLDEASFNGYFSDEKITDIEEDYIASTITEHDLNIIATQLEDSVGLMFPLFGAFAVIIYILIIYLLARLVVEKNVHAISMIKILGYSNREADGLYNAATAIIVILSLIISIPICSYVIRTMYYIMMIEYPGWLTYYIAPWVYPAMIAIGACCYLIVHIIEMRKIRRIPLSDALKNME